MDEINNSSVVKCEKYCLMATLRYHTVYKHQPFDDVYAFFKLATDGRPGTEFSLFKFDKEESSFRGFSKQLGEYHPEGEAIPLEIAVDHAYEGTYPRVYLFQRFTHRWFEDVIKFYVVPAILPLLLVFIKDFVTQVGIVATLVVADVALLFVNTSPTLTFNEQATIMNLVLLIITAVVGHFYQLEASRDISDASLYCAGATMILTGTLAIYHHHIAMADSAKVLDLLKAKNLKAIQDLT